MRVLAFVHIASAFCLVSCQTLGFIPQNFTCRYSYVPIGGVNSVPDSLKKGDTLFSVNNLIGFASDSSNTDFLQIQGENVTLRYDMIQYCVDDDIEMKISCAIDGNNETMVIRPSIIRKENYRFTMEPLYTTSVQEMTPPGTQLEFDEAIKVKFTDCLHNTISDEITAHISIINDDEGYFRWGGTSNFAAFLVNNLTDYERNQYFRLELQVYFKDLNAINTTEILVNVTDIDDNNPVFNLSSVDEHYILNVKEENATTLNTSLPTEPTIYAYDPDFGINQTIKYSIKEQSEAGLFHIDPDGGALSISKELDRETKASYRLIIRAEQTDNPTRAVSAVVQVTVLDIDDHLPVFRPINVTAEVTEHSASGTFIRMLNVFDPDEGDNANFTCVLFDTTLPINVATVNGGCNVLVSDSQLLDREQYPNGEIVAQIGAKASLKGVYGPDNATLTIKLKDINDNSPTFTKPEYIFIFNNSAANKMIGEVKANDSDDGGNGNVTYSLLFPVFEECSGGGSHSQLPYYIDTISGFIQKNSSDDPPCEIYRSIVKACDNPDIASTSRCSTVSMVVSTTPIETVRNISQTMHVSENLPEDSYVDSLKPECRGNGFTYTVLTAGDEFSVSDGFVKSAIVLDREQKEVYPIDIEVENSVGQTVCYVNVTINVTDVNDNPPRFTNSTYTFNLPENANDGQSIGYLKAEDVDIGENGIVEYMMYNQGDPSFAINNSTGEITIKFVTMVTPCDIVTFNALARDKGTPVLESVTQVYIVCHSSLTSVPISVPLNKEQIEDMKVTLESEISHILNITIVISVVSRHARSVSEQSQVLIRATNPTVQQSTLLQAVVKNYESIRALFYHSNEEERQADTSGSTFGAPEIALIAMGVVIIIGAVVAIVIINRQFNSQKRYKQLYESLTKNSSLYESQEIKVKLDDEMSYYNATIRSKDLVSNGSTSSPALTVSAVNPGYVNDDQTHLKQEPIEEVTIIPTDDTTNNTVKEAIKSLERLSDRLDQEEEYEVVTTFNEDPIQTDDDIPLVDTNHDYENANMSPSLYPDIDDLGDDHENGSPVLYANVTMNNENETQSEEEFPVVSNKARNSLEIPRLDGISSNTINVEAEINHTDQSSIDEDNDTPTIDDDEPNPDYDVKQVRFSGEVLDADDNVLQPLKPDKDVTDGNTGDSLEANEQNEETDDMDRPRDDQVEPGWVEEEIQSPVNTVVESETGEEFYFCEDALTHL